MCPLFLEILLDYYVQPQENCQKIEKISFAEKSNYL